MNNIGNSPLDLSKWRNLPFLLMGGGGLIAAIGLLVNPGQFAYAWLHAFMFFLSLGAGSLFLVLVHHLFDASWSVPIRRICEQMASLLPWMLLLFIPLGLMAKRIYPWMSLDPLTDHALNAKQPLFTVPGFFLVSGICFLVWWWLTNRLLSWSLEQDRTGGSKPTYRLRFYSGLGVILYAVTLTFAVVLWMKSLEHQWFSTMYAVYYFAGSAWLTLATVYVITMLLDRMGVLSEVLHEHQYYYLGSLLFAFTVFYAYVTFSQYFIIWNANIPEETFWYILREKGTWWYVGLVIIFGHFFIPFLALLRIDVKSVFPYMTAIAVWAWLMHWLDLSFNILPIPNRGGFPFAWIWIHLGCWAFMGGFLGWLFLRKYWAHPPYPIKDPRLGEALGLHQALPEGVALTPPHQHDEENAPPQFGGNR
jgi:hypothetical protein